MDTLSKKNYVIRIHKPSDNFSLDIFGAQGHSLDLLAREMDILNALREGKDITVQEPVKNKEGSFVSVLADGTPATLLTWVDGETVDKLELTYDILFKIGETIGKFHRTSKTWNAGSLGRYSYDSSLLSTMLLKLKKGVGLKIFSKEQFKILGDAIREINVRMNELDMQENSKGLVHSDLSKSNLIVSNGQIVPIDFCLCGSSYYYMDLGSLFSHFTDQEHRSILIKGYKSIIDGDIRGRHIETFLVFQIILFLSTHIESASKWDWFNGALDRWCRDFFIPLSNNTEFIIV